MTPPTISRRAFLHGRLSAPLYGRTAVGAPSESGAPAPSGPRLARIELAHCLSAAYQVCSVCTERCGARGAIMLHGGLPVVDAARCTGCGECADVCPSPLSAIRMVVRPESR